MILTHNLVDLWGTAYLLVIRKTTTVKHGGEVGSYTLLELIGRLGYLDCVNHYRTNMVPIR